jgi:hypothetical protein
MSGFANLSSSRNELQELMAVLTTADEMLSLSKREAESQNLSSGAAAAAAEVVEKKGGKKKKGAGKSGGYGDESLDVPLLTDAFAVVSMEEGREKNNSSNGNSSFGGHLSFVTGVMTDRTRLQSMERVLWRATRGNLFFRSSPAQHAEDTHVFVVLFQGPPICHLDYYFILFFLARICN